VDGGFGDIGPGVPALSFHGVERGHLGRGEGVEDSGVEEGAVEGDLAIEEVEFARGGADGQAAESGGAGREVAIHQAAEGAHERVALVGVEVDLLALRGGKSSQRGQLLVVQEGEHIAGGAGEEARIVAHVVRVVIAQELKAGVVGDLAGGEEGLGFEVAGEQGEAGEGEGGALGEVGEGLLRGEAALRGRRLGRWLLRGRELGWRQKLGAEGGGEQQGERGGGDRVEQ